MNQKFSWLSVFFLFLMSTAVHAQEITVFDSSTPMEKIRSLDGAVIEQSEDGLLLQTRGSQSQGKTVYPGFAVLGEWELKDFNAVEIELVHRDSHSVRLPGRRRRRESGRRERRVHFHC